MKGILSIVKPRRGCYYEFKNSKGFKNSKIETRTGEIRT